MSIDLLRAILIAFLLGILLLYDTRRAMSPEQLEAIRRMMQRDYDRYLEKRRFRLFLFYEAAVMWLVLCAFLILRAK